jgi:multidrug efflux pump subunit AcrA (membrane-fusion protein)
MGENETDKKEIPKTHKKILRIFRWIFYVTIGLLVIAWLILWYVRVYEVIIADGIVEPKDKIELRSRAKDVTLEELFCEENTFVAAGQAIAKINDRGEAEKMLKEVKIRLMNAQSNFERSGFLLEKGLISEKQALDIKMELDVLKSNEEATKLKLGDLNIRAPRDGKIVYLPKKAGEQITLGDLIALLAPSEEIRLRFWIETDDAARVSTGQKVELLWIGSFYRDLLVGSAHIVKICPYAVEKQGKYYFEALADIDTHWIKSPLGTKLRARIVGEKKRLLALLLQHP